MADPDVTTRCYYDGDQVIEDTDASANVQRYYVWGNTIDELLMMWREEGQTDADYFVARNHLFSPVALVKKSDVSITERYEYDAYGKVTFMASDYSALNPQQSSIDNRYLFTGRELDTLDAGNLKIMYYRARTYDPLYGRFLQRDPIGYVDGMNLYEYAQSCPMMALDPTGTLCCLKPKLKHAGTCAVYNVTRGTCSGTVWSTNRRFHLTINNMPIDGLSVSTCGSCRTTCLPLWIAIIIPVNKSWHHCRTITIPFKGKVELCGTLTCTVRRGSITWYTCCK